MRTLKLVKLHKHPEAEPTGYAVGFVLTAENGRSEYIDTYLPFESGKDEEYYVNKAKNNLLEQINAKFTELENKSSLIGLEIALT